MNRFCGAVMNIVIYMISGLVLMYFNFTLPKSDWQCKQQSQPTAIGEKVECILYAKREGA